MINSILNFIFYAALIALVISVFWLVIAKMRLRESDKRLNVALERLAVAKNKFNDARERRDELERIYHESEGNPQK